MPIYRVDILVESDIVFSGADEVVEVSYLKARYKIKLKNGAEQDNKIVRSLNAVVIGEAENMDEVGGEFRGVLARWLDSLAYVCQCNFIIKKVWRVVEWEPWRKTRKFKALNVLDKLPDAVLSEKIIHTANTIAQSELPPYVRRALQCFRTGLYLFSQEERFMQFWTAVEVLADGSKERKPIPIPCGECGGSMACDACGNAPSRIPVATQAIQALFGEINVPDAKATYKWLSKVRNGLAHGRSSQSIEDEIGKSVADSVQMMGMVACNTIRKFVPSSIFDTKPTFKSCGGPYVAGELIGGPVGEFDQPDNVEFPNEALIPDIKIDMVILDGSGNQVSNIRVSETKARL